MNFQGKPVEDGETHQFNDGSVHRDIVENLIQPNYEYRPVGGS